MKTETIVRAIQCWYDRSTPEIREQGMRWYESAFTRVAMIHVNVNCGVSLRKIAGVIAALSPAVEWELNQDQAENFVHGYYYIKNVEGITVSTYGQQRHKALGVLKLKEDATDADILAILGSRAYKTRAFYDNIIRWETSEQVTIDRHILSALGFPADWWLTRPRYDMMAHCIAIRAKIIGIRPNQLQSILWLSHKNFYKGQE